MPPLLPGPLPGNAKFWANLRDGQDMSNNPLRVGFTCRVIKDWHANDSDRVFEAGMTGKVLAFNEYSVSVGFQGLQVAHTVPRDILEGGPVRWGIWTTRDSDLNLEVAPSNTRDIDLDEQFPKAVQAFMLALKDSNFAQIGVHLSIIGSHGENIDSLTRRFVGGVRNAGLLDTFNMPDFTVQDIIQNASLTIGNNDASRRSGVYLRIYTHIGEVHEIETYVGKSKRFCQPYLRVVSPAAKTKDPNHWIRHHSDDITAVWVALCILDNMPDTVLLLAEQILVSLLETYRADMINPTSTESEIDSLEGFQSSAMTMHAVAGAAQQVSKWPGATLSRPQRYGAAKGMNISSPIVEQGRDRSQFIRQDALFDVTGSDKFVPVSNFRRAIPKTAKYNEQPGSKNQQVITWITMSYYDQNEGKLKPWHIASLYTDEEVAEAIHVPPPDTVYGTVFEVRLDGKPHPMTYFRGPKIPIFHNSDIADSWALRIEWTDPKGQPRSRYVQPMETHYNWNYPGAARGASEHYLRCISLIHHLFHVPYPDLKTAYIDMGAARVIQAHRDGFLQETTYGPQTPYPIAIVYSRVSDRRQIQMMKDGGLHNVNIPHSTRPTGPIRGALMNCDSCQLEATFAVSKHAECVEKTGVGKNVCERCYDVFGRAACSFTPNQRSGDKEDKPYRDRFRPLLHMTERITEAIDTVDPKLRLVPGLDEEEEVSEGEMEAFI
jgi:hypothetical protein